MTLFSCTRCLRTGNHLGTMVDFMTQRSIVFNAFASRIVSAIREAGFLVRIQASTEVCKKPTRTCRLVR
jgi:hypothetical protein